MSKCKQSILSNIPKTAIYHNLSLNIILQKDIVKNSIMLEYDVVIKGAHYIEKDLYCAKEYAKIV